MKKEEKEKTDRTKRGGSVYLDIEVWERLEEVTKDSVWSSSSLINMIMREKLGLPPKVDMAQKLIMGDKP